jgi:hypothetical protein
MAARSPKVPDGERLVGKVKAKRPVPLKTGLFLQRLDVQKASYFSGG